MIFAAYFDPRGLGITLSLCALTLAAMLAISSRAMPHRMPGVAWVTSGVAVSAVGLAGNMLQGLMPEVVTHFLANVGIVAGLALALTGTMRMRQEPAPVPALVGIVLIAAVGLYWFSMVESSSRARVVMVAASLSPLAAWTAWTAWQDQRPQYRVGFRLITTFGGVLAVLLLARLMTASILGTSGDAVTAKPINVLAMLVGGLALIAALLGVVFIHAGHLLEQLHWQAQHDPMSGLMNRQGLRDWLRAQAADDQLVVVAIDLDHFKRVNDVYGHVIGDQVIGRLATDLQELSQDDLLPVRMGGEEFAVMQRLDDTNPVTVRRAMERLVFRINVLRERFGRPDVQPHCTFSAGIATGRVQDFERVMREADTYLYTAKRTGRNRVVTAASHVSADGRAQSSGLMLSS